MSMMKKFEDVEVNSFSVDERLNAFASFIL
jgi:hypothetical protein